MIIEFINAHTHLNRGHEMNYLFEVAVNRT